MNICLGEQVSDEELGNLVAIARDFAFCNGFVLRSADEPFTDQKVVHAPFTLFPSPFPKSCYKEAYKVQKYFNVLMHQVAHDKEFLYQCLKETIKVDDFTSHLWDIYETVEKEGRPQDISLAMNRSDYMLDCGKNIEEVHDWATVKLKQIEFNTMASSMGGLAQQLSLYHRFVVEEVELHDQIQNVPANRPVDGLAEGVAVAWKKYGNPKAVFLSLVYEVDRNIYDQRHLEFAIRKKEHRIRTIRRTLKDLQERGSLTNERHLIIDGFEVAIVYQRSCYVPQDFQTEQDWATRLMIERSKAIKCPNVHYHLAGTKKVQQELARPGQVERFIQDTEAVDLIRSTFAGLYSLDYSEDSDAIIDEAIENPQNYVLKPQREGGGNNTFGDDIPNVLRSIRSTEERKAYILMDRIFPAPAKNYAVRPGQDIAEVTLVGEIGIYGTVVGTSDEIFHNETDGHVLRSKTQGTDEGGVATGYAVLDSPFLINTTES